MPSTAPKTAPKNVMKMMVGWLPHAFDSGINQVVQLWT